MSSIILFLKSHVAGYTRRDGTYVKPHNRKGGPAAHEAPGQLALFTTPAAPVQDDPEADLRAMWTKQGVPKEKQDELIAAIGAKAAPGAKVGPFTIGGNAAVQRPEAVAREAMRSTKAGPNADEAADPRRKYYVTMAREGRGVARLAGPFDTHEEALAHVDRAREEAEKADPRASFDSFGTAGVVSDNHRPGVLNERLGIGAKPGPRVLMAKPAKEPTVERMMSDGTYKNWKKTVPRLGVVNGWDLFQDRVGDRYVLMTSYNSVGFDSETAAREWASKNKANRKGNFSGAQTAPAPVTVASRKRIRDPIDGSHTELTLSNGKVARIQRMSSGSTMGLAGWHDLDGGQYSYLDDTEEGAIKELLRRHNAAS